MATFHQPVAPVVTYYHADAIGSVRALTDASGAVVLRHDYLPFGEDTQALTGDPRRFTTVDPGHVNGSLLDPQGWNAYGYAATTH